MADESLVLLFGYDVKNDVIMTLHFGRICLSPSSYLKLTINKPSSF